MKFQPGQCRKIFDINVARCRPCAGFDETCPYRRENGCHGRPQSENKQKEARNDPKTFCEVAHGRAI